MAASAGGAIFPVRLPVCHSLNGENYSTTPSHQHPPVRSTGFWILSPRCPRLGCWSWLRTSSCRAFNAQYGKPDFLWKYGWRHQSLELLMAPIPTWSVSPSIHRRVVDMSSKTLADQVGKSNGGRFFRSPFHDCHTYPCCYHACTRSSPAP